MFFGLKHLLRKKGSHELQCVAKFPQSRQRSAAPSTPASPLMKAWTRNTTALEAQRDAGLAFVPANGMKAG